MLSDFVGRRMSGFQIIKRGGGGGGGGGFGDPTVAGGKKRPD